MKSIERFQTFDGQEHETQKAALHYLDRLYGDTISRMAHRLCAYSDGKYQRTMTWMDENLGDFLLLKQIKDDMAVEIEED